MPRIRDETPWISFSVFFDWVRGLFRRPSELFEFFSGVFSFLWLTVAWFKGPGVLPSISWFAQLIQNNEHALVGSAMLAALVQLGALATRNNWLRFTAACFVGTWFSILMLASYVQIGIAPTQVLYCLLFCMNGYVAGHVLDGNIIIQVREKGTV